MSTTTSAEGTTKGVCLTDCLEYNPPNQELQTYLLAQTFCSLLPIKWALSLHALYSIDKTFHTIVQISNPIYKSEIIYNRVWT